MKQYTSILIENRANLRIIKFNNPKRKNAFDMHSYVEIPDALKDAENDDSVSIVALTGVGDFYSSGNDIKAAMTSVFSGRDIDELLEESHKDLKQFVSKFYSFKKPLVAVINGPCIGIGATTAALCDVLYASESAYFYTPFTLMGLCPEGCSSYTFPKMLGPSKANEMLMFHHKLSAQEAYQYKFVAELFNPDEIEAKIWQKLEKLSKLPPTSLQSAKMLTKKFELERLEEANVAEIAELINRWKSEEAMNAAMEFTSRKKSKL